MDINKVTLYSRLFLTSNVFFSVLWNPSGDGTQLITLSDQHLKIWKLSADAQAVEVISKFYWQPWLMSVARLLHAKAWVILKPWAN
jgi:hypothetical protein